MAEDEVLSRVLVDLCLDLCHCALWRGLADMSRCPSGLLRSRNEWCKSGSFQICYFRGKICLYLLRMASSEKVDLSWHVDLGEIYTLQSSEVLTDNENTFKKADLCRQIWVPKVRS